VMERGCLFTLSGDMIIARTNQSVPVSWFKNLLSTWRMAHLHCQSVRTALYGVFVQPAVSQLGFHNTRPILGLVALQSPSRRWKTTQKQRLASSDPIDTKPTAEVETPKKRNYKDRVAERETFEFRFGNRRQRITPLPQIKGQPERQPQDTEIKARYISLVDRDGNFHPRVNTNEVLLSLNTADEHLIQVVDANAKDPHSIPTCRVFTKEKLRERARQAAEAEKERSRTQKSGKLVEMNWAIAPGDLDIKARQICAFLEEGRKVDVTIAPKRRGRKATPDEMKALMSRLRDEIQQVDGAKEMLEPEGKMGGIMTMKFSGSIQKRITTSE